MHDAVTVSLLIVFRSTQFDEDVVGKAIVGRMCSTRYSGGVNSVSQPC